MTTPYSWDTQDKYIPVAELAAAGGYTRAHLYQLIKDGRAPPRHGNKGVLAEEGAAWLKKYSRRAKQAAKDKRQQRLQELRAAASAPDGDV